MSIYSALETKYVIQMILLIKVLWRAKISNSLLSSSLSISFFIIFDRKTKKNSNSFNDRKKNLLSITMCMSLGLITKNSQVAVRSSVSLLYMQKLLLIVNLLKNFFVLRFSKSFKYPTSSLPKVFV